MPASTYIQKQLRFIRVGLVVAMILVVFGSAPGQQVDSPAGVELGVYGGGVVASPAVSFHTLPGVINCLRDTSRFTSGSGGGFDLAAVVGYRPSARGGFASHIGFTAKLGYSSQSTTFETDERIGSAIDSRGRIEPIIDRYTIETSISELRIEPVVDYYASHALPLRIGVGGSIGYLMSGEYSQTERLISPSGASFADGREERNVSSGSIEGLNGLQVGAVVSLGYELELSPILAVRPEISARFAFTSPIDGIQWSANELRAGVMILLLPEPLQSTPLDPKERERQ